MGRLDAMRIESSNDILRSSYKMAPDIRLRDQSEGGPVKSGLELSEFEVWDQNTAEKMVPRHTTRAKLYVRKKHLTINPALAKQINTEARWEFLVNRKGNIVVMRTSDQGLELRKGYRNGLRVGFTKFATSLLERNPGMKPVAYVMEYNEEVSGWVGRLDTVQ